MDSSRRLKRAPADLEDAWSLRLAGRGDEQALVGLYERHGELARRRAMRALCDRRLAEDVVHDAFVDLWRTADSFDPQRATVRAWICVLVHRRAAETARKEAHRRLRDERAREPHPSSLTAEELALLSSERRRIQASIKQLEESRTRVVDLGLYRGLDRLQSTTGVGLPPGTVKARPGGYTAPGRLGGRFAPRPIERKR